MCIKNSKTVGVLQRPGPIQVCFKYIRVIKTKTYSRDDPLPPGDSNPIFEENYEITMDEEGDSCYYLDLFMDYQ